MWYFSFTDWLISLSMMLSSSIHAVSNGKNPFFFIAAQFIIAKIWKQPKCPSTDEWIGKLWYIYTIEYYAAVKKKELESSMLSKISQSVKDKYYIISLICGI